MTRDFALGDILSVTTERLVSRDHIDGVYRILNFMTGDDLFTHQLPRANNECRGPLLAQHPQLETVVVPDEFADEAHVWAWLSEQEQTYGLCLPVSPLVEGHAVIDPIEELCDMIGPEKVLVWPEESS